MYSAQKEIARLSCSQASGEAFDQYVERFLDLYEIDLDYSAEKVNTFIGGIAGIELRRKVREHVFQVRSIKNVADYTNHLLTQNRMEKALARASLPPKDNASAGEAKKQGNVKDRLGNKRSNAAAGKPPSNQKIKSAVFDATKTPTRRSDGGAQKNTDVFEKRRAACLQKLKEMQLPGCIGCMANHAYEPYFAKCSNTCVFCGMTFTSFRRRHLSAECRKMPTDPAEAKKMIVDAAKQQDK